MVMDQAALHFDEATHTYTLGGRVLPSVTQVLDTIDSEWKEFVDPVALEEAKIRGRHVHRLVELDVRDELDEDSVAPAYQGHLRHWRAFMAETRFKPILAEQRVHHADLGYAGTLDLLGMIGSDFWLVDVKTGTIPRTVGLQTAAYQVAGQSLHKVPFRARRAVLLLHEDKHRFVPIDSQLSVDIADFAAALRIHQWRNRNA